MSVCREEVTRMEESANADDAPAAPIRKMQADARGGGICRRSCILLFLGDGVVHTPSPRLVQLQGKWHWRRSGVAAHTSSGNRWRPRAPVSRGQAPRASYTLAGARSREAVRSARPSLPSTASSRGDVVTGLGGRSPRGRGALRRRSCRPRHRGGPSRRRSIHRGSRAG